MKPSLLVLVTTSAVVVIHSVLAVHKCRAQHIGDQAAPGPGPMLNDRIVNYETPDFTLRLVRSSQTVVALKSKGADGFDLTPGAEQ
ncbi:MAG: hypothetical protein ACLP56_02945 [Candidatus Sulfotelmatobacter sp.]